MWAGQDSNLRPTESEILLARPGSCGVVAPGSAALRAASARCGADTIAEQRAHVRSGGYPLGTQTPVISR